jgi:hypothetical protein
LLKNRFAIFFAVAAARATYPIFHKPVQNSTPFFQKINEQQKTSFTIKGKAKEKMKKLKVKAFNLKV